MEQWNAQRSQHVRDDGTTSKSFCRRAVTIMSTIADLLPYPGQHPGEPPTAMLARWADNATRDARMYELRGEQDLARLAYLRALIYVSAAEEVDLAGADRVVGSHRTLAAGLAHDLNELERAGVPIETLAMPYIIGCAHQAVAAGLSGEPCEYIKKWS
ncbi:hypothetical protein LX15_003132 [Streptoalloteichus tenebrarius]|uniref:Uncharacterized protein n=1 Tax=Streptoalloteichus tenebrarius (strain ATCC 17920 / DSM 40477 / JCM 4838 / CBS 697.72 / NBRC 16177 / NCIMB 11028 / NRRL B-12390 / A12253. 1 / ISP 5477) TaxID=1933 RepID=A0ABT1HVB1_STRSD|nr:hypothetical protein [Streptoalloteichus tenebrarius]MCP2259431.1 hypothetical protein [Streptoalloteichus tenebrarius]BFF02374.1 hypothetical protein GCM10020241_40490 [Streptoalloteichus tenebrarius]